MNRRRYLATVGGVASTLAVAGCLGDDSDDSADDGTDGSDDSSGAEFSLSPDSIDDASPVSYSASLGGGGYDDTAGPLSVEITLENTADATVSYGDQRTAQFQGVASEGGRWALYDEDWEDLDEDTYEFDGCWKRTGLYVATGGAEPGTLAPGDSHERSLVVTTVGTGNCPATTPEEISFVTDINVWEAEEPGDEEDATTYEWGFTLTRG